MSGDATFRRRRKSNWSWAYRLGMLACVVLAGVCVARAFGEVSIRMTIWTGVACCFAVFARMFQAAAHHGDA